jgi:hypothetical protein
MIHEAVINAIYLTVMEKMRAEDRDCKLASTVSSKNTNRTILRLHRRSECARKAITVAINLNYIHGDNRRNLPHCYDKNAIFTVVKYAVGFLSKYVDVTGTHILH